MRKYFAHLTSLILIVSLAISAVASDASKMLVLDVRTPVEYSEKHLVETTNVDFLNPNFKTEIAKYDREKTYKLYCRSGNRSSKAIQIMKDLGFKSLENLGSLQEAAKKLDRNCEPAGC